MIIAPRVRACTDDDKEKSTGRSVTTTATKSAAHGYVNFLATFLGGLHHQPNVSVDSAGHRPGRGDRREKGKVRRRPPTTERALSPRSGVGECVVEPPWTPRIRLARAAPINRPAHVIE